MHKQRKTNFFLAFAVISCAFFATNNAWALCSYAGSYSCADNGSTAHCYLGPGNYCNNCPSSTALDTTYYATCGSGSFTCKNDNPRYTVNNKEYGCFKCPNNYYVVNTNFDYNNGVYLYLPNSFSNCARCPDNLAANHIASCGTPGTSYSSFSDALYYVEYPNEQIKCEDGYNLIVVESSDRYTDYEYQCLCQNMPVPSYLTQTGWESELRNFKNEYFVYTTPSGSCKKCGARTFPSVWYNKAVTCSEDENNPNTITCANYSYRVIYSYPPTNPNQYYGDDDYHCPLCPYIKNTKALGLSNSSSTLNVENLHPTGSSWSSTSQCTYTTPEITDSTTGCKYKDTVRPDSTCRSDSTLYVDLSSTGQDPSVNLNSMNWEMIEGGCNYELTKRSYTYAPAGYGVRNNNTSSASCAKCANGYYKPSNDLTACKAVPANSTSNEDRTDFVCNEGYVRQDSDNTCIPCPKYLFDPTHQFYDHAILIAMDSDAVMGTPYGNMCKFSNKTYSTIAGTYESGECTYATGISYGLYFQFGNQYCPFSLFYFSGIMCTRDLTGCEREGCGTCRDNNAWVSATNVSGGGCSVSRVYGDNLGVTCNSLSSAQQLVSTMVSATSNGPYPFSTFCLVDYTMSN